MPARKHSDEAMLEALREHRTIEEAAKALGIHKRSLYIHKARLAKRGFIPEMHIDSKLPEFLKIKGTSQLMKRGEAEPVLSWIKTNTDNEALYAMVKASVEALCEDIPRVAPAPAPMVCEHDLLNCYVITDYHFGQLSWGYETRGADYNLQIAEDQLMAWFGRAIAQAPAASTGMFAQLGDFLHYSGAGLQATTESSGHILDADGRFQKLVRVIIRVIRRVVDMLLAKHEHVVLLMAEGNHDISASCWLREMLFAMYEHEPRITVDRSADPYYAFEFGATSLFFHHGHKRKVSDISKTFTSKFREIFGRTRFSYAHMGHLHHRDVKEDSLMVVEQHRTLAASDAHASRGGWLSGRDAQVISYHRAYGEVGRIVINSDMLREAAA